MILLTFGSVGVTFIELIGVSRFNSLLCTSRIGIPPAAAASLVRLGDCFSGEFSLPLPETRSNVLKTLIQYT